MSHTEFADLHLNALAVAGLVTHHVQLDAETIDQTMEMRLIAALAEATDDAIVRIGVGRVAVGAIGDGAARIASALEAFDTPTTFDAITLPEPDVPEAPAAADADVDAPDLTDRFDAIDAAISALQERMPDMDAFEEKQNALATSVAALHTDPPEGDNETAEMLTQIADATARVASMLEAAQTDGDDDRLAAIETGIQSLAALPEKLEHLESNLTEETAEDAPNLSDILTRIDALAGSVDALATDAPTEDTADPFGPVTEKLDQLLDANAVLGSINDTLAQLNEAVSAPQEPTAKEEDTSQFDALSEKMDNLLAASALSDALTPINDALTTINETVAGLSMSSAKIDEAPEPDAETQQMDATALADALAPINAALTDLNVAVSALKQPETEAEAEAEAEAEDISVATAEQIEALATKIDAISQNGDNSETLMPIAEALAELTQKLTPPEDPTTETAASASQIEALEAKIDALSGSDELLAGLDPIKEALTGLVEKIDSDTSEPAASAAQLTAFGAKMLEPDGLSNALEPLKDTLAALIQSVSEIQDNTAPQEPVASPQLEALAEKVAHVSETLTALDPIQQALADQTENLAGHATREQVQALEEKIESFAQRVDTPDEDGDEANPLDAINANLQTMQGQLAAFDNLKSEVTTTISEQFEGLDNGAATRDALTDLKECLEALSVRFENTKNTADGPNDPQQILLTQSSLALQSMLRRLDNQVSAIEAVDIPDPSSLALTVDAEVLGDRLATEITGQNAVIINRLDAFEKTLSPKAKKTASTSTPTMPGMIFMPAGVDQVMRSLDASVQQLEASLVKEATEPDVAATESEPELGATNEFLDDLRLVFAEFLAQIQRQSGDVGQAEDIA